MASNLNHVLISGRLVATPESRQDGKIAGFSVAVNKSRRNEDGSFTDEVSYFDASAWNGLATRILKLRKGDRISITGKLVQNRWQAEDGSTRSRVSILVDAAEAEGFFRPRDDQPAEEPIAAPVVAEPVKGRTAKLAESSRSSRKKTS